MTRILSRHFLVF